MNAPAYTHEDILERKVDFDMSLVYGIPFIEVSIVFYNNKYLENNTAICFKRHLF